MNTRHAEGQVDVEVSSGMAREHATGHVNAHVLPRMRPEACKTTHRPVHSRHWCWVLGFNITVPRRRFGGDKKCLVSFRNQKVKPHRLITVSHKTGEAVDKVIFLSRHTAVNLRLSRREPRLRLCGVSGLFLRPSDGSELKDEDDDGFLAALCFDQSNGGEDPYAFIQTEHGNLFQDFGSSSVSSDWEQKIFGIDRGTKIHQKDRNRVNQPRISRWLDLRDQDVVSTIKPAECQHKKEVPRRRLGGDKRGFVNIWNQRDEPHRLITILVVVLVLVCRSLLPQMPLASMIEDRGTTIPIEDRDQEIPERLRLCGIGNPGSLSETSSLTPHILLQGVGGSPGVPAKARTCLPVFSIRHLDPLPMDQVVHPCPRQDNTQPSHHAATTAIPQQFSFTRLTVMDNYPSERSRLFTPDKGRLSLLLNSHETGFCTASTFKVAYAIGSGVRPSLFSPGVVPNSHETAFSRTSPLKAILAIGSGIRSSLFFPDYLRVFSGPGVGGSPGMLVKARTCLPFIEEGAVTFPKVAPFRYRLACPAPFSLPLPYFG
ncbi:hypothetical protein DY000_02005125 [Brassica cretica]|uniref:Uncharacterized protein n=1 Tax=Brassica cretica TaxID=69181 RepID=A0ABQ7C449_BRACR|nr:hypothetical protein DY000_02005125 [Brassica cretica]